MNPNYSKHIASQILENDIMSKAMRDPVYVRYDLIPPESLQAIAEVFDTGAKHYGERNWQQSRLKGEKSPVNHALAHLYEYIKTGNKKELAHAAVNCMMEYWYEEMGTEADVS